MNTAPADAMAVANTRRGACFMGDLAGQGDSSASPTIARMMTVRNADWPGQLRVPGERAGALRATEAPPPLARLRVHDARSVLPNGRQWYRQFVLQWRLDDVPQCGLRAEGHA